MIIHTMPEEQPISKLNSTIKKSNCCPKYFSNLWRIHIITDELELAQRLWTIKQDEWYVVKEDAQYVARKYGCAYSCRHDCEFKSNDLDDVINLIRKKESK